MEVRKIQQAKNLPDEQAMMLFQQNFEHALDQLIGAIRNQYNVTEKAMDASFKLHQVRPVQSVCSLLAASVLAVSPPSSCTRRAARSLRAAPPSHLTCCAALYHLTTLTDQR